MGSQLQRPGPLIGIIIHVRIIYPVTRGPHLAGLRFSHVVTAERRLKILIVEFRLIYCERLTLCCYNIHIRYPIY